MKSSFWPLRQRIACLGLLVLGLAAHHPAAASAGVVPAQQTTPAAASGLRVIVTPLANSAVLRVRYESAHYGSVRLELRDARGRVLYSELKRQARFAGDFDLAAYPAGAYTLVLATPAARHTQLVRLTRQSAVVATLVGPAAEPGPLGLVVPGR